MQLAMWKLRFVGLEKILTYLVHVVLQTTSWQWCSSRLSCESSISVSAGLRVEASALQAVHAERACPKGCDSPLFLSIKVIF